MKRPSVAVSAVVVRDGKLLMVRREPGRLNGGRWSLPGGHVEHRETLAAAARREVHEETGLRVRPTRVIGARERIADAHYVIVVMGAELVGGRLRAGDDAAECEWVPLEDVSSRWTTAGLPAFLARAGLMPPPAATSSTRGSPAARTRRASRRR